MRGHREAKVEELPLPDTSYRNAAGSRTLDLAALQSMTLEQLRSRWTAAFGIEPLPRISRELLLRAVANRLQERARGGVPRSVLRRLQRIAAGQSAVRGGNKGAGSTGAASQPGTRLLREWQGKTYEVLVLEHGFLWNGATFASLSEIARLITGARWSGPRFFGLKENQVRSKAVVHE